jgi:hypothetical protein
MAQTIHCRKIQRRSIDRRTIHNSIFLLVNSEVFVKLIEFFTDVTDNSSVPKIVLRTFMVNCAAVNCLAMKYSV